MENIVGGKYKEKINITHTHPFSWQFTNNHFYFLRRLVIGQLFTFSLPRYLATSPCTPSRKSPLQPGARISSPPANRCMPDLFFGCSDRTKHG